MNTISKVLTLLISAALFITTTAGVSAQSDDQLEYERLYEKYNLVPASEVPEGIQPIVINSPEELEKLLQNIGKQNNVVERHSPTLNEVSLNSDYVRVERHCTSNAGTSTFNTWADIIVRFDPGTSVRWIESATTRVGLSGANLGTELVDTYERIDNRGNRVIIVGGGTANVHLIIEGGLIIHSSPVSCTIDYSVY